MVIIIKEDKMNLQTQPIWITLELFIEDGQTKIVCEQSPKNISLNKGQKIRVSKRIRLIRERAKIIRTHGTDFRINDGFGV